VQVTRRGRREPRGAESSRGESRGAEGTREARDGRNERERERGREARALEGPSQPAVYAAESGAPVIYRSSRLCFICCSLAARPPPPPPGPARVGARERAIVHVQHLHYPPSRLAAPVMNRSRVIGRVEKGRSSRARAHRVLLLGENRSAPHNPAVVGLKPARCGFISQSRREDN